MTALLLFVTQSPDLQLIKHLENATVATARYGATDDRGDRLDCLKIVEVGPRDYVGVYHVQHQGVFRLRIGRSKNLLTWSFVRDVDGHAHQGALTRSGREWLLAYEKDGPGGNWIRLRRYSSLAALLYNKAFTEMDLPRQLSSRAEGTPSFRRTQPGGFQVELGFHYLTESGVDRQAVGVWGPKGWSSLASSELNEAATARGVKGNLGDRDPFTVGGRGYELLEGQLESNDWSSWRVFLRRTDATDLMPLRIRSPGGSKAFANPTASAVTLPDGKPGLVVTLFVPTEGAANSEAGCLIYYFRI